MNMQYMNEQTVYRVSDFPLAVVLSGHFPVQAVDKQDPYRAYFLFQDCAELRKIVEQYHKRELVVEPQQFFFQSKIIKSRLYEH